MARPTLNRIYHAPGDILAKISARERRSAIAWLLIFTIVSTPFQWPYRNVVALVWVLSQVALIVGLGGMLSAETPVESEDG